MPVDLSVERRDGRDAARFGARDEVRLGEVESFDLVHLEGAEEERFVDDDNSRRPDDRAHELCQALPLDLVERLQDADDLRDDQVGEEKLVGALEEGGRSTRGVSLHRRGSSSPVSRHRARSSLRQSGDADARVAVVALIEIHDNRG